jgi:hypothetical protein
VIKLDIARTYAVDEYVSVKTHVHRMIFIVYIGVSSGELLDLNHHLPLCGLYSNFLGLEGHINSYISEVGS